MRKPPYSRTRSYLRFGRETNTSVRQTSCIRIYEAAVTDFVWRKIGAVYAYCLTRPNSSFTEFRDIFDRLASDAKRRRPTVIAGDFAEATH